MAKDLSKYAHPTYLHMKVDYEQIRDCFNGERAVKAAGIRYLPKLKNQTDEDYRNYIGRALFFPITGKTCSSMVGLATVKPPETSYPAEMKPYFVDTEGGFQFTEFYTSVLGEVILMGRHGVLIDAKPNGQLHFVQYNAENIINWRTDANGVLTMVLLRECIEVPGADQFETVTETQFRHCFIDSAGVYTVEVLDEDLALKSGPIRPIFTGSAIDFIPFIAFGATGVHMAPDKPPMLDISSINISHYLTSADLEWGRHIVGLPTPVATGVESSTSLHIGGTRAWILPPAEAKAFYLEFQGQGLQSLEKAMTDKVSLMASISARLIDNSTRGSEAAETVRLRYLNESASLLHIITAVEAGMTLGYSMLARLMKAVGEVTLKFNREVIGVGITFKDLKPLIEGFLEGAVSKETLIYNMRRLDAISPHRTDEEEAAAISRPAIQQPAAAA